MADQPGVVASLYGGLAGLGFAALQVSHARGLDVEELCAPLDETLANLVTGDWPGTFDLIGGLVGVGVYGIERQRAGASSVLAAAVVDQLRRLAISRGSGLVWIHPGHGDSSAGTPAIDLGVAHGLAGVVAFLASCLDLGIEPDQAATLLEGAVSSLVAGQLPIPGTSRFPAVIRAGEERRPTRLAWCYGDAGIALTLIRAGLAAGRPDWVNLALDTGRLAARRPFKETGVTDAGLCHGAAGLAHLFNRLFQTTGDDCFRWAAVRWYRHALDQRTPGQGIGGYRADWKGPAGLRGEVDTGFLEGAAGIGLALLAVTTPGEPAWDRALLLS
jgi:hypothetical protein